MPPLCSPVNKPNKSTTTLFPAHCVTEIPVPALTAALIVTVTTSVSMGQPPPPTVYVNVLVLAPDAGVKVPLADTKVPPVPVVLVHVPPVSSPVNKEYKSIAVVLSSHTVVLLPVPAVGAELTVTVTSSVSLGHGDVPVTVYLNTLVVADAVIV